MNIETQQKILEAGKTDYSYSRETWFEIIDALMEEFEKFTGFLFERSDNAFFWEMEYPSCPSFAVRIKSVEPEQQNRYQVTQAWLDLINNDSFTVQFENSVPLIQCVGSINGRIVEIMREDYTCYETFLPYIRLIVFDSVTKKNLTLNSGEMKLNFEFECKSNNDYRWISYGWCPKELGDEDNYQWDDIDWNI